MNSMFFRFAHFFPLRSFPLFLCFLSFLSRKINVWLILVSCLFPPNSIVSARRVFLPIDNHFFSLFLFFSRWNDFDNFALITKT